MQNGVIWESFIAKNRYNLIINILPKNHPKSTLFWVILFFLCIFAHSILFNIVNIKRGCCEAPPSDGRKLVRRTCNRLRRLFWVTSTSHSFSNCHCAVGNCFWIKSDNSLSLVSGLSFTLTSRFSKINALPSLMSVIVADKYGFECSICSLWLLSALLINICFSAILIIGK